jgi:LacI family sucrose operon transcriptional repressor
MATLKDVASKTGLTVSTVSRVLNNRGYLSEETRNKVYLAMKELNYQPNEVARSLSKQKSNTIGVIVPHIVHPYFAKLISCIELAVSKENYKILLCNSREETEKELDYIQMFKSNRVAGIILCSYTIDIARFLDLNIPLVTIERTLDVGTASIECDNCQGGILAAKHLAECGCKNVVHFSGIRNAQMPADGRSDGFISVCKEREMQHKEYAHESQLYYEMEYHSYIEQVLNENPEVDGIFASSDLIAAQVIQVCAKKGIHIPEQIKLIGFDDVNVASLTTPTITTIKQPIKEMADQAVQVIVKTQNGEVVPSKIILPVSLIQRESTLTVSV